MPRFVRIAIYILVPLIILTTSTSAILELLWMDQLGYAEVFWTVKAAKIGFTAAAFLLAAAYLIINARILADELRWASFSGTPLQEINVDLSLPDQHRRAKRLLTLVAGVLAFMFAFNFFVRWDESLRFLWNEPFGRVDPIFGHDIGFYMFQLPFWEVIQTSFTVLAFFTMAFLVIIYAMTRLLQVDLKEGVLARPAVRKQVGANAFIWLILLAWGLYLARYELLFSRGGIVFGAGYTDVGVELPAIWITLVLALVLAVMVLASRWVRIGKWIPITGLAFVIVWLVGRGLVPGVVQQFTVEPNELVLEQPYLENNIAMTRLAYGLDDVQEVEYQADDTLTLADIQRNRDAVNNIRLWDPRLLIQTYRQLQEIRTYYQFYSVDNDRYHYGGDLKQVMLSSREITRQLPSQSNTWVNEKLQFTHGYGLAMSPVTETDSQGEPILIVKDLPPQFEYEELAVDNPAIYYGESSGSYYIVNTGVPELHYPDGDDNVYTSYDGQGGIPFRSWFHRLLFAWELGDINILLSDYIEPQSRLQIWRGVQERVNRIAPFLMLDRDPYLVLSGGRLYWIQDAYTTSNNFPYSQPFQSLNYIRNSVKIVVDAYEGSVDFYVVDEEDPVLQVYESIFPDLFKDVDELEPEIQRHFRYPQDLFEIQLQRFNRYHMTQPQVFYNQEDLWTRPNEKYGGEQMLMEPYYVLARLPEGPQVEADLSEELLFMLISPLTPENRDNMISWMAAKSDGEDYGQLVVYKLPKQRLIYGPAQIEARIDQDPEISEQLALWDQRGSRVIRGNLMVIPIENSFLYVEPVFLLAEGVDIPQLQRVIVAIGDDISMQPTLDEALFELFGDEAAPLVAERRAAPEGAVMPADTLIQQVGVEELEEVRRIWGELRTALEGGDWARYGELMDELEGALEE